MNKDHQDLDIELDKILIPKDPEGKILSVI